MVLGLGSATPEKGWGRCHRGGAIEHTSHTDLVRYLRHSHFFFLIINRILPFHWGSNVQSERLHGDCPMLVKTFSQPFACGWSRGDHDQSQGKSAGGFLENIFSLIRDKSRGDSSSVPAPHSSFGTAVSGTSAATLRPGSTTLDGK